MKYWKITLRYLNIEILADGLVQEFYTVDVWRFLFLVGVMVEHTLGAKMVLYLLLKVLTSDWSANAVNIGKIIKLISSMLTLNLNTQDRSK